MTEAAVERTVLLVAAVPVTLDTHVAPIAEALVRRGWRVVAACGSGRPSSAVFTEFHQLPNFRRAGPFVLIRTFRQLVGVIRRTRPDVIQLNTPFVLVLGRVAAAWVRRPTV